MISRRGFLAALTVRPAAPAGFIVTGPATATETERTEGYAQIGREFALVVHPKSAAFPKLQELIGQTVRVTVEPA